MLIYPAVSGHALRRRVRALVPDDESAEAGALAGTGSVLLIPELLTKPLRDEATDEVMTHASLLARLDLTSVDEATARLAAVLGASYRLRAADAVHLASAVAVGADRFITNNPSDFPTTIRKIDVTYPSELPDP